MHREGKGKRALALMQERAARDLEQREVVVDSTYAADGRDGAQDPRVVGRSHRAAQFDLAARDRDFDLGAESAQALPHPFGDDRIGRAAAPEEKPRNDGAGEQPYREEEDLARFHFRTRSRSG